MQPAVGDCDARPNPACGALIHWVHCRTARGNLFISFGMRQSYMRSLVGSWERVAGRMAVKKAHAVEFCTALLLGGCSIAEDALFPSLQAADPAADKVEVYPSA